MQNVFNASSARRRRVFAMKPSERKNTSQHAVPGVKTLFHLGRNTGLHRSSTRRESPQLNSGDKACSGTITKTEFKKHMRSDVMVPLGLKPPEKRCNHASQPLPKMQVSPAQGKLTQYRIGLQQLLFILRKDAVRICLQ